MLKRSIPTTETHPGSPLILQRQVLSVPFQLPRVPPHMPPCKAAWSAYRFRSCCLHVLLLFPNPFRKLRARSIAEKFSSGAECAGLSEVALCSARGPPVGEHTLKHFSGEHYLSRGGCRLRCTLNKLAYHRAALLAVVIGTLIHVCPGRRPLYWRTLFSPWHHLKRVGTRE